MIRIVGVCAILFALSACGISAASQTNTYCLEEKEANGLDYMVVTDFHVCDIRTDDVEIFETDVVLNMGDVAYVEADGSHSSKSGVKSKSEVRIVSNPPVYTPAKPVPTKICLKAYSKPAPPKPAPVVPKPAPVPVQPAQAPIAPKPAVPAPTAPKATVQAPTIKPGC